MGFSLQCDVISRTIIDGITHDSATWCMIRRHRAWPSGIAHDPMASYRQRSCAWCSGVAHDVRASLTMQRPRACDEATSHMWWSGLEPQTRHPASPTPCGLCWILYLRNQCCGPALVLMRIRIQFLSQCGSGSRSRGAKQMQTHVDPDPAPGKTWKSQTKSKFFTWKINFKFLKAQQNTYEGTNAF